MPRADNPPPLRWSAETPRAARAFAEPDREAVRVLRLWLGAPADPPLPDTTLGLLDGMVRRAFEVSGCEELCRLSLVDVDSSLALFEPGVLAALAQNVAARLRVCGIAPGRETSRFHSLLLCLVDRMPTRGPS